MKKEIGHLLEGRAKSIGKETVIQPLPHKDFRFASPFIVIHHLPPHPYEPHSPPERIPPHPHRGFAPVTFLFQGEGYHKDSFGNKGVIKAGEVQWMFAGKGLLHSEGPTDNFLEKGGTYEFVQIWINVPAQYKMGKPYYQQAANTEMPSISTVEGINLKLASGSYGTLSGPIKSFTPVTSIFGTMQAGKSLPIQAQEGYWTLLYVLEGKLLLNDVQEVAGQQLVVFSKEGTDITIQAKENSKVLYLSGEPINETVAAKGNFVMNTQEEVAQAEKDYAAGKFGVLDF